MSDRELDRIYLSLDKIESKVDKIDKEMTTLKVKVAMFSSVVGAIVSFIAQKFFGIQGG